MKNITLAHDLPIQGYGTIKAGTKLPVQRFNSRYIYTYINQHLVLRLTYKDITQKRPKTAT